MILLLILLSLSKFIKIFSKFWQFLKDSIWSILSLTVWLRVAFRNVMISMVKVPFLPKNIIFPAIDFLIKFQIMLRVISIWSRKIQIKTLMASTNNYFIKNKSLTASPVSSSRIKREEITKNWLFTFMPMLKIFTQLGNFVSWLMSNFKFQFWVQSILDTLFMERKSRRRKEFSGRLIMLSDMPLIFWNMNPLIS